jgi:hypothetical protein
LHADFCPPLNPVWNHFSRSADEPWVNADSSTGLSAWLIEMKIGRPAASRVSGACAAQTPA